MKTLSTWRWLHAALLALLLAFALLAAPAAACGCGGYIPRDGDAYVAQERALVRWDGKTEDIVMAFGVQGSSKEAAWIMPVPARATAKLADARLFDALQELTKPRVEVVHRPASIFLGGSAAAPPVGGAPPVALLDRQAIGPFDVSTLAATDAGALSNWLQSNGYTFPPKLADVLKPYVAQNWFYVAVRLQPGANTQTLKGALDPLWVTFASDKLIYPMRASAIARTDMPVTVYVLADHRVQKAQTFGSSHVAFADWVEPALFAGDAPLAPFVTRKQFLTRFDDQVSPPRIDDDFVFSFAPADEPYHDVVLRYVDDDYTWVLTLLGCAAACVLSLGALLLGALWLVRRRRTATLA